MRFRPVWIIWLRFFETVLMGKFGIPSYFVSLSFRSDYNSPIFRRECALSRDGKINAEGKASPSNVYCLLILFIFVHEQPDEITPFKRLPSRTNAHTNSIYYLLFLSTKILFSVAPFSPPVAVQEALHYLTTFSVDAAVTLGATALSIFSLVNLSHCCCRWQLSTKTNSSHLFTCGTVKCKSAFGYNQGCSLGVWYLAIGRINHGCNRASLC